MIQYHSGSKELPGSYDAWILTATGNNFIEVKERGKHLGLEGMVEAHNSERPSEKLWWWLDNDIHRLENSKSLFITVSVVFIVQYTPIFFFMIFLSQMLEEGIKLFLLWLFLIFDIINNGVFENRDCFLKCFFVWKCIKIIFIFYF